jgi:hypothetical protein
MVSMKSGDSFRGEAATNDGVFDEALLLHKRLPMHIASGFHLLVTGGCLAVRVPTMVWYSVELLEL